MLVDVNKKSLLIFISLLVVAFLSCVSPLNEQIRVSACSLVSGKFSASTKGCIYKNCAENGTCQSSYNNGFVCNKLKLNISKNEVFFELGMPVRIDGSFYYFNGSAGNNSEIKAVIKNDKVEYLVCGI